jgi:hypothetical protein
MWYVWERNAYRILVGQAKIKGQLARSERRWADNIKMDLQVIWWEGVDWNDLAEDRDRWRAVVDTAMNIRVR